MNIKRKLHTHNGASFNHKEENVMFFAGKWMELEIIMLCEVSQTLRAKYLIFFSHMWNSEKKSMKSEGDY
jgi:hypothetical protein